MNSFVDTSIVQMITAARSTTLDESLSFVLIKQLQWSEQQTMMKQKSLEERLDFNILYRLNQFEL